MYLLICEFKYTSLAGIKKSIHRERGKLRRKKKNLGKGESRGEGLAHGNRKHPVTQSIVTLSASRILFLGPPVSHLNIFLFSCL